MSINDTTTFYVLELSTSPSATRIHAFQQHRYVYDIITRTTTSSVDKTDLTHDNLLTEKYLLRCTSSAIPSELYIRRVPPLSFGPHHTHLHAKT